MEQEHIFNENLAITNSETSNALIDRFNKIQEISDNKKWEWEDEPLPEKEAFIIYDKNEWVKLILEYDQNLQSDQNLPEELKLLLGKSNPDQVDDCIENYIDGFMTAPYAIYNSKSLESVTAIADNFDDVKLFLKNLKANNDKVFLYEFEKIKVKNLGQFNGKPDILPDDMEPVIRYKIRYGLYNHQ